MRNPLSMRWMWGAVLGAGAMMAAMASAAFAGSEVEARQVLAARFATFNRHDLKALVALYAPNAVLTSPGFCHDRLGREGARKAYEDLFRAAPDISDEVTLAVIDHDHIAVQFIARSTRPGAAFAAPIANFLTLDRGLIIRDDALYDARGRPCA